MEVGEMTCICLTQVGSQVSVGLLYSFGTGLYTPKCQSGDILI